MIVIDCSVFMAVIMKDENSLAAKEILGQLSTKKMRAIVPKLFFIEATNVVVSSVKKGRIDKQESSQYIALFSNAPIKVDDYFNIHVCAELAIQHELSIYDAIYLEVAMRNNASLATLDKKLLKVAHELGVAY